MHRAWNSSHCRGPSGDDEARSPLADPLNDSGIGAQFGSLTAPGKLETGPEKGTETTLTTTSPPPHGSAPQHAVADTCTNHRNTSSRPHLTTASFSSSSLLLGPAVSATSPFYPTLPPVFTSPQSESTPAPASPACRTPLSPTYPTMSLLQDEE
jgi:hypothetical protein